MGNLWRHFPLTLALVSMNGLVFLLQVLSGLHPLNPPLAAMVAWGANVAGLTLGGEPWRLLSSMFLHMGLVHLGFNMLMLVLWGPLLERQFGRVAFLLLFVLTGLSGALLSALWALFNARLLVSAGASGALMGMAGSLLVLSLYRQGCRIRLPAASSMLLVIGINLLFGLLQPGIDNAAHIGGLLAGVLLTPPLLLLQRWLGPAALQWMCMGILLLVLSVLLLLSRPARPVQEAAPRPVVPAARYD